MEECLFTRFGKQPGACRVNNNCHSRREKQESILHAMIFKKEGFEGIVVIILATRFSNLEILAKMEEEMEEKERLERGEPPKEKKEEEKVAEKVEGEKETAAAEVKKEESAQASAVNSREDLKMSRENSYDRSVDKDSSEMKNTLVLNIFSRMEHSKSELDLGYTQGQDARRSQWEDWEGWNPPSHHSGHYPDEWARYVTSF